MSAPILSLNDWFSTPQGAYLLAREQAYFEHAVADIFGFNALQLGLPERDFLHGSRIPLRVIGGKTLTVGVWLELTELPFESDSLDLVVMPHVLEFNSHPHAILREVERVLRPEGQLLISGFNPRSLWGLRRVLGSKQDYPWCGQFIALHRLKDWLALLGLEVGSANFTCYAPPVVSPKWLQRFHCLEPTSDRGWAVCGGAYFLHAVKRTPGMRVIRPQWNAGLVSKLLPVAPKLNRNASQQARKDD